MLRHVFSVACQSASVDQFSNTLSMHNTLERVNVQSPTQLQITDPPVGIAFEATIVSVWYNDGEIDEESKQRITLLAPDGRTFNPHDAAMIVKASQVHRMIAKIQALPYFGSGRYWFEVSLFKKHGWEPVAKLPFHIDFSVIGAVPAVVQ